MVKPVIGCLLLVAGMIMIITVPLVGIALLGLGYWMLEASSDRQKSAATDTFFGISMICMLVYGLIALVGALS